MKLHANAALSLKKRQLLAERVVEEGWSLTEAAAAARWASGRRASGPPTSAARAVTVCSIALTRIGLGRLGRIERGAGKRITGGNNHYNRTFTDRDGKRRNTVGWEFVHIAIDDATRLAYAAPSAARPRQPASTS